MAAVRRWYIDAEWFDPGFVLVRQSANSFLVSLTATGFYTAGRRLRLNDSTTIYGEVLASGLSGANTLVTVSSSALTASLSSGSIGIANPLNISLPYFANIKTQGGEIGPVLGTEVDTSTGATSYDLSTTIPSWVKRIEITFEGFGTNGTSIPLIQIGDAGGPEIAGYTSSGMTIDVIVAAQTTGFPLSGDHAAARRLHGTAVLLLKDSTNFTWSFSSQLFDSAGTRFFLGSGTKSLSAALDRVRITTVTGVNTGAAGSVNIQYE